VLTAVGIPGFLIRGVDEFVLQVPASEAEAAARHLWQYEAENRTPRSAPPASPRYPYAWVGCIVYSLVLLGVAYALSNAFVRLDAFELGELDAAQVQAGQYWRAWTALTLHLDLAHLAANLLAGLWFGYLAATQMGAGTAWLLIVTGAGFANLLEALIAPPEHRAVGASTAVFTALGAMAAHSFRERLVLRQRWERRWGPLIAGVGLLGFTGSAGEDTDVTAHVAGFVVGAVLGALAALPRSKALLERVPQWLAGALALGSVLIAWCWALRS